MSNTKSFISSLLSKSSTKTEPPTAPETAPEQTPEKDDDARVAELIEVYFTLESADERDVVFDELVQLSSPLLDEFLQSMLHNDADEFMQISAAAALAKRQDSQAIAILEQHLQQPEDMFFFQTALNTLLEIRGQSFYETLAQLWQNVTLGQEMRREALLGMEQLDTSRALSDFVRYVDGLEDAQAIPEDQLEVIMLAFARYSYAPGMQCLSRLRERVMQATFEDDAEKTELMDFIQEGIDLIQTLPL